VGIIVVIPCLYLLFNDGGNLPSSNRRFLERARVLVAGPLWLIAVGFIIGLFLGHPMLFLDCSSVIKAITGETLKYASLNEFNGSRLFNLSVVWKYVTYLVPFAMYPLAWVLPYCAIIYLLFRRSLYSLSVPILLFSLLYLYLMGKGYLGPYFGRITMLLMPGFCVLVGIAWGDLQLELRNKRTLAIILTGALLLIVGLSVTFDVAYGRAMQQRDAREVVRSDVQKLIGDARATIGVSRFGPYFYTVTPAVEPLKSEKVIVQVQDAGQNADFFLLGFPRQVDPENMKATIRAVEGQGRFKYEKSYRIPVKIFGYEFWLGHFPADMTYPFPTILLFRSKGSP
jgi:hypothetical protein